MCRNTSHMLRFFFFLFLWNTVLLTHTHTTIYHKKGFYKDPTQTHTKNVKEERHLNSKFSLVIENLLPPSLTYTHTQQSWSYVAFLVNKLWWVWAFRAIDHYRSQYIQCLCACVCLLNWKKWKKEMKNKFDTFHLTVEVMIRLFIWLLYVVKKWKQVECIFCLETSFKKRGLKWFN